MRRLARLPLHQGLALGCALGVMGALGMLQVASCNAITGANDLEVVPPLGSGAAGLVGGGGAGGSHSGGQGAVAGAAGGIPIDGSIDQGLGGTGGTGGAGGGDADIPDALDPSGDEDQDGHVNSEDNCPYDFNPCQYDVDFDGTGDDCDATCEEGCHPWSTPCGWPGAVGCNCASNCGPGYRCVHDEHAKDGKWHPQTLPDGGTHNCELRMHHMCTETCSLSDSCTNGTCYKLTPGCICWSPTPLYLCDT